MAKLRPYQLEAKNGILAAWAAGIRNVMTVLPTGAGKTVTFSDVIHSHQGASCAIAHRQELVTQISMALARDGVYHRIIGPKEIVKLAVKLHMDELGTSYYRASSQCAVAGVDTLIRRKKELGSWLNTVTLWVMDECHHVLEDNKWGLAVDMFPNAKGLGVTATPSRADGKGLGAHADGVFETMIVGPSMRDLINMGFLTEYRVFAPPSDIDLSHVSVSAKTGDYSQPQMVKAVQRSHIVGDIVAHYLRIAKGKLGVAFVPSIDIAETVAAEFNAKGVPAAVVSSKTKDADRVSILAAFKRREYTVLVNVDLFGEGFDLPAIETVIMARPTQSYGLYVQQFGRALRLLEGKDYAIVIDHVGNVVRHGLPDAPRAWTLDRREKRNTKEQDDVIPVKACPSCTGIYERVYAECPYCGFHPKPAPRSGPEQVDGDLTELDAETLARMRGEVEQVDRTPEQYAVELAARRIPLIGQRAMMNRHIERRQAQAALRESIAWWAGHRRAEGMPDSEAYRRFYFKFGVDVLTAQALKTPEAMALAEKINMELAK